MMNLTRGESFTIEIFFDLDMEELADKLNEVLGR